MEYLLKKKALGSKQALGTCAKERTSWMLILIVLIGIRARVYGRVNLWLFVSFSSLRTEANKGRNI